VKGILRQADEAFEAHQSWPAASPAQPRSAMRNRSGLGLGAADVF
jgi:hypothetical protein